MKYFLNIQSKDQSLHTNQDGALVTILISM